MVPLAIKNTLVAPLPPFVPVAVELITPVGPITIVVPSGITPPGVDVVARGRLFVEITPTIADAWTLVPTLKSYEPPGPA